MNRANMFGDRILRLRGGSTKPIFIVEQVSSGGDESRGIAGNSSAILKELFPRPTLTPANPEQITRQSAVLQLGDHVLEISGSQVSEAELKNKNVVLKVGGTDLSILDGDLFNIITYDARYLSGNLAFFRVFVRGVVT